MKPIQIIVVDDHPLFRQGVEDLLKLVPGFVVIATGARRGYWIGVNPR